MAKVILNVSMSLDGFITGPNDSVEVPMGEGGERLHEWMFKKSADAVSEGLEHRGSFRSEAINTKLMKEMFDSSGAFLMGRRMFDHGEGPWGKNPPFQMPVFVVTHRKRETLVKGKTSFTFFTGGPEAAAQAAKAAAGDKNVIVAGADITRQLLKAALVDEMNISLVPVLFGRGRRLFDDTFRKYTELEVISVIEAPGVTHLRFRVIKNKG